MSNIKHNDELLRVHDDGFDVVFNCDNKHQNGVSYHAEKNGKKTKIDPEYAMATLVKKISGGGWPAELPKPSVGGYGYTEQGEQTVITWDGNITGRESLVLHGKTADINAYKVAEKDVTYTNNAAITITNGATEDTIEAELVEYTNCSTYAYLGYPFVIIATEGEFSADGMFTGVAPSDGVYFAVIPQGGLDIYGTSLTYGTPDTVHKIDEKYLPESGGGAERFLVEISGNGDTMTSNHTSAEIATAFNNGKYIVATWNENMILQLAYIHADICRFVGLREGWLSDGDAYVEGCSYAEVLIQGDAVTGFDNYIDFSYFQPKN